MKQNKIDGGKTTGRESAAWSARAEELTRWAKATLVNRRDVYGGQYRDQDGEIKRTTWRDGLSDERLVRHFAAETTEDVIGLHSTAPDETCCWAGIDIDRHDGDGASAEANLRFARQILRRAYGAGIAARLIDSSGGRGGFHVWLVAGRPIPMADARRLACWMVRDWAEHGLPRRPDLFPGNVRLTKKRCGNYLRAPGRHHRRPSWARVLSPGRKIWRAGDGAIDALLSLRGGPVEVSTIVPADFDRVEPGRPVWRRPESRVLVGDGERDLRLARSALEYYPNDDLDYDEWLRIGMALRGLADEEAAFELWDRWSAQCHVYDPGTTADTWKYLRPAGEWGGVGLGTLFAKAMERGWSGPAYEIRRDARGGRRITHRSGRKGMIVVPARRVARGEAQGQQDGAGKSSED
jgi:Primase C terminal 2 (PriCT-2)